MIRKNIELNLQKEIEEIPNIKNNPMNNISEYINDLKEKNINDIFEEIKIEYQFLNSTDELTFIEKCNSIIKLNNLLFIINCKDKFKKIKDINNCILKKENYETLFWEKILELNGNNLLNNLKENKNILNNTKIYLESLIISFSNFDSYNINTAEKAIYLFNSFLIIIENIFEEFENKSILNEINKEEIMKLLSITTSSSLQISDCVLSYENNHKKKYFNLNENILNLYINIQKLRKIFIKYSNQISTKYFYYIWNYFQNENLEIEIKGIKINIPFKDFNTENNKIIYYDIFIFNFYPLLTYRGYFLYNNIAISFNLIDNNYNVLNISSINNNFQIYFPRNLIRFKNFDTCYNVFDLNNNNKIFPNKKYINSSSNDDFIICQTKSNFNDIIIGYNMNFFSF